MPCTFKCTVKDDVNADKLVITASGLVDAEAASWKVEVHDITWPANKTASSEQKKMENEANWKTMNINIRPKTPGRILVWRAQCSTEEWTEWTLLNLNEENKKVSAGGPAKWDAIFAEAGYVKPEAKPKGVAVSA